MRTLTIALLSLMLLGAPTALAQGSHEQHNGPTADADSGYTGGTVEVPLHLHLYNLIDKVPMNTQMMDAASPDLNRGPTQPRVVLGGQQTGDPGPYQLYAFNSPGPVHYNISLGEPRIHPERGLSEDLQLDTSKNVMLHLYLSADDPQNSDSGGSVPELNVRATLRTGDDPQGDLDAGEIISQVTHTLENFATGPGEVAEIVIDMGAPSMAIIPASESFNLKLEFFTTDQNGNMVQAPGYNIHSGAEYDNRIILPVQNPIRINYLHPQFIGSRKVAIHTAYNSPFGNYDVDFDNLQMTITGPGGEAITPQTLQGPIIVQRSFEHNHHFEPVLVTWVWNYRVDAAAPGDYTVEIRATNLPGNAEAVKTAQFTVTEQGAGKAISSSGEEIQALADPGEETKDSPAPLLLPLLALGGVATAARRQRATRRDDDIDAAPRRD